MPNLFQDQPVQRNDPLPQNKTFKRGPGKELQNETKAWGGVLKWLWSILRALAGQIPQEKTE